MKFQLWGLYGVDCWGIVNRRSGPAKMVPGAGREEDDTKDIRAESLSETEGFLSTPFDRWGKRDTRRRLSHNGLGTAQKVQAERASVGWSVFYYHSRYLFRSTPLRITTSSWNASLGFSHSTISFAYRLYGNSRAKSQCMYQYVEDGRFMSI